jgi:hypothetical protein
MIPKPTLLENYLTKHKKNTKRDSGGVVLNSLVHSGAKPKPR